MVIAVTWVACVAPHGVTPPAPPDTGTTPVHSGLGLVESTPPELPTAPELAFDEWAAITWVGEKIDAGTGMALTSILPVGADDEPVLAVGAPNVTGGQNERVFVLYSNRVRDSDAFRSGVIGDVMDLEPLGAESIAAPLRGGDYLTYTILNGLPIIVAGNSHGNASQGGWGKVRKLVACPPGPTSAPDSGSDSGHTGLEPGGCPANSVWSPKVDAGEFGWAAAAIGDGQVLVGAPATGSPQTAGRVYRLAVPFNGAWSEDPIQWFDTDPTAAAGWSLAVSDFDCTSPSCDALDAVIGAPLADEERGRVYVILDAPTDNGSLASLAQVVIDGGQGGERFGSVLHTAPSDADPGADLWIGDGLGWTLVSGATLTDPLRQAGTTAPLPVDSVSDLVLQLYPDGAMENRVTCDGIATPDLDADGVLDLAVGGCGDADGVGRVYILFGPLGAGGRLQGTHTLSEVADVVLVGHNAGDHLGSALAVLSDPTAADRLVVGAWGYGLAAGDQQGAVMVASESFFAEFVP